MQLLNDFAGEVEYPDLQFFWHRTDVAQALISPTQGPVTLSNIINVSTGDAVNGTDIVQDPESNPLRAVNSIVLTREGGDVTLSVTSVEINHLPSGLALPSSPITVTSTFDISEPPP